MPMKQGVLLSLYYTQTMLLGVPRAWDLPLESADSIPLETVWMSATTATLLTQLQGLNTAEANGTLVDSTKSIKTSTSYQRLEVAHAQETDLGFQFGKKLTTRKSTVAERSDNGEAMKNERSASRTVFPSITAWLADVKLLGLLIFQIPVKTCILIDSTSLASADLC